MSNPFDVTENDSDSSRILTSMASSINDEYISSSTKSSTTRSRAFTHPPYHLPSRNTACYPISEAQSATGTDPEDLMQQSHTHLRKGQLDDRIEEATLRSSKVGINDPGEKSASVSEAIHRASKDQPREPESISDRLHTLPEGRQYIMQKFLNEETHQLAGVLNEGTQKLSCTAGKHGHSSKHALPQGIKSPLGSSLVMMGAFTEDFDDTKNPILERKALAKEYAAYESRFDKPREKSKKLENCTNSF